MNARSLVVALALVSATSTLCSTNTDCNLNGVCAPASGVCACYKPWGGTTCGVLKFAPAPVQNGYGRDPLLASSWGGRSVLFEGVYHLIVAEMVNNCTLEQWGSNSQCTYATAPTPEGPYTKQGIALGVWCHNPELSMYKSPTTGETYFALWHIGDGRGGNPQNCNTSAGTEYTAPDVGAGSSQLHLASSPAGPWTPVMDPLPNCNNPTQLAHPNGTWFLVCNSNKLWRAPNITGPYSFVLSIPYGSGMGTWEDGFLFLDMRGNWHQLFHAYTMTCATSSCDPTAISGHSFSADGTTWVASTVQPYFNTANMTDGSVIQMSTRERPKLIFSAVSGEPTHLINGICDAPNCAPAAAIQCKVDGHHTTNTLVVPLSYS
jgi:hypothetical protein